MYQRSPLVNGEYYHIFNRGVAKQPTFYTSHDYTQALHALDYYRFSNPPIRLSRLKELSVDQRMQVLNELHKSEEVHVKIISFVFMPNHFHFLLQQVSDKGISTFLSKFTNSYTRFINTKHDRVGPLFQGLFKSVHISSAEQFLHVSRYIHLNPLVSFVVKEKDFLTYPYSSLPDYLKGESQIITLDPILSNFKSPNEYRDFILDHANYAKTLEEIKHLTLED